MLAKEWTTEQEHFRLPENSFSYTPLTQITAQILSDNVEITVIRNTSSKFT